ncbi:glyoxalase-like domain-containing protein [Podospora aff. communis PSN243]|uniref:Glyoxalase-like domain-containing protein n=1 Tax=Podospora aff. communis PSN243 TaxID=3040156 RepID=A0AAV9GF00_9PEZI|nr:glyoxalase-like domain-containing protein [Podospora aff. communis PSN243]
MATHPQPKIIPTFYLNIHTSDPEAASEFFTALDFPPVTEYSDAETKSFRLPAPNSTMCLMLHGHKRMKQFMRPDTEVNDAHKTTEALFSLAADTKEQVDEMLGKAVKAGGTADPYVMKNYGADCGMYSRSFADLDGHIWEVVAMLNAGGEPGCEKKE